MPKYLNMNSYDLNLIDQFGNKVKIKANSKIVLPDYFDRYASPTKKMLKKLDSSPDGSVQKPQRKTGAVRAIANARSITQRNARIASNSPKLVGQAEFKEVTSKFKTTLLHNSYPVSNNIGVGVLSHNRYEALKRLVDSIINNTNLNRTTVFISDDGSTNEDVIRYLHYLSSQNNFVVLLNTEQIGIAGNSNRLLKCLDRFKYKLLLNDDVEVLRPGWESFYFDAMKSSSFHHFCFRQPGIYGAKIGNPVTHNGVKMSVVTEKPHGAVLAIDDIAFKHAGYLDESFGIYGLEHVDWSERIQKTVSQPIGYFDVDGSLDYFLLHNNMSAVANRMTHFKKAKKVMSRFDETRDLYVSSDVEVPSISYVIPFRETSRADAISTVVNNIRAQKFPRIDIILSEHDVSPKLLNVVDSNINQYVLHKSTHGEHFNKSKAFNNGVALAKYEAVVLHDADTLAPGHYTKMVFNTLSNYDSCHICSTVYYTTQNSAKLFYEDYNCQNVVCDRIVTYFEGGSLACKVSKYWDVGGFVEDYDGYGCEDCDFYARLKSTSGWLENRSINLLHLWHDRSDGWNLKHNANKKLLNQLNDLAIDNRIGIQREKLLAGPHARFIK